MSNYFFIRNNKITLILRFLKLSENFKQIDNNKIENYLIEILKNFD